MIPDHYDRQPTRKNKMNHDCECRELSRALDRLRLTGALCPSRRADLLNLEPRGSKPVPLLLILGATVALGCIIAAALAHYSNRTV